MSATTDCSIQNDGGLAFPTASTPLPYVSVVVPALNCVNDVAGFASCMRAQSYPADRFEVIVVDNGSSDGTFDSAKRAGLVALSRTERGRARALNAGLARARGEYILTTDISCRAAHDWIESVVSTFRAHPKAACVAGDIKLLKTNDSCAIRFQERNNYMSPLLALSRNRLPFLPFADGANASFTRQLFDEIGGFDESFMKAADVEICYRLLVLTEYHIVFNRNALLWEPGEESLRALLKQRIRMGLGTCLLAKRFPGFFTQSDMTTCELRSHYWRLRGQTRELLQLLNVNLVALSGRNRVVAEDANILFSMKVAQRLGEALARRKLEHTTSLPEAVDEKKIAAFAAKLEYILASRIRVVEIPAKAARNPAVIAH